MSRETVTLHYDGPALADHQMDVAYLAPALYGLNDLCKVANRTFNEERASVRVLVNVDREQHSFVFDIEIVMSLIEQTRALLADGRVQDAKSIAEWIGILGGSGYGFLRFLRWLAGRRAQFESFEDQDGRDMFRVTVNGDNNHVVIAPEIKALHDNRTARQAAKRIVEPLGGEGYESLQFLHRGEITESFDKEDALEVLKTPNAPPDSDEEEPQMINAWVTVHSPILRPDAQTWRFIFNGLVTPMDISETSIVADALRRGVNFGDSYRVKLEITQVEREPGNFTARYKIKEVLDFRPGYAGTQEVMDLEDR